MASTEEIKAKAREFDITTDLGKEQFIDTVLEFVENGEPIDELILSLFDEGFEHLEPHFEEVEMLSAHEAMTEVKRVKD